MCLIKVEFERERMTRRRVATFEAMQEQTKQIPTHLPDSHLFVTVLQQQQQKKQQKLKQQQQQYQ